MFGLPLMCENDYDLYKEIRALPYAIHVIQYRLNQHMSKRLNFKYISDESMFFVFNITPGIQNDIYYLHCIDDNREVLYDTAHIPNYKTSVMMNALFRDIKENRNLDLLEESDEEEEFENIEEDKFVYLDRNIKMRCIYNVKFKKWIPVECADNTEAIAKKNNIV